MKIAPTTAALPSPFSNPAADAPSDSTLSFETLLDEGVTLKAEQPQRAFGFSERGLLVSWGEDAGAPPRADRLAPSAQMVNQTQGATLEKLIDDVTPAKVIVDEFEVQVTSPNETASWAPRIIGAQRIPELAGAQVAAVTVQARLSTSFPETRPPARTAAPTRQAPPAESRRLSLVISEQNGTVQIIAGAPELSPEARARLRKAAAALAAEFGVTLSEFTINGGTVDPIPSSIGAPYGDFAG
jgi:hypothetical protein